MFEENFIANIISVIIGNLVERLKLVRSIFHQRDDKTATYVFHNGNKINVKKNRSDKDIQQ